MTDELTPETPDEDEQPIKQRKNGLYPGVSDELAENMKGAGPTPSCATCSRSSRPRTPPAAAPRCPRASQASVW